MRKARNKRESRWLADLFLAHYSTLKKQTICFPEISVDFRLTTQPCISQKDRTPQGKKFYDFGKVSETYATTWISPSSDANNCSSIHDNPCRFWNLVGDCRVHKRLPTDPYSDLHQCSLYSCPIPQFFLDLST
jgi:hypothetical protein